MDQLKRAGLVLAFVLGIVIGLACEVDLVGPGDPGFEELCLIALVPGDTIYLTREMFDRCDPAPAIYVVDFG